MKSHLLSCLMCIGLAACASAANPGAMSIPVSQSSLIDNQSSLYKSIQVPTVEGGKETSPLWKSNVSNADFAEALRQSLAASTILATENARFKLTANLVELDQPIIGFSMKVTSKVNYKLINIADGSVIFEKEITAPYTARTSDAFLGVKRLQLANEGSIRENIKQFIDALVEDSKTNPKLKPVIKPLSFWDRGNFNG